MAPPLPVSVAAPPPAAAAVAAPEVAAIPDGAMFDPGFCAGFAPFSPARSERAAAIPAAEIAPPAARQTASAAEDNAASPPARPAEVSVQPRSPASARDRVVIAAGVAPAPAPDARAMEKLFGAAKTPAPALGYASAESAPLGPALAGISGPSARYDRWTAVYDLSAHTVYLPSGARLEAHSGLGDRKDDPAHVYEHNRGATPPHVYELAALEQPFHGVRALRLNPVGGGGIFGRDGLLAHTYMLGPRGDSNGCVVFRNYAAFLQAYQTGQVKRLAVVARLD
jgi:hypothetical protein